MNSKHVLIKKKPFDIKTIIEFDHYVIIMGQIAENIQQEKQGQ